MKISHSLCRRRRENQIPDLLYSSQALRKLIIPLVLEQILSLLVGMADTVMIAGVGEAAVSGVSLVDTVNILVINVFVAFGTGGAVVSGHFLGQGDPESAGKAAWQVNLLAVSVALAVTAVFLVFRDGLLRLIFGRVEAQVMYSAGSYLAITALSIAPLAVYNACAAQFRAMGDSRTTMWISLFMNFLNILGNALLIYGARIGTAGAAIATTVSRTVAAAIILYLMFHGDRLIHFRNKVTLRLQPELIRKILYIAVPNSLENSLFQLGKILTISLIATYGTYSIAANAVTSTIAGLNVLPASAVNNALLAVVAVCVGADQIGQARFYTRKLMKMEYIGVAAVSVILITGARRIIGIYQLSPQATELATRVLTYYAAMAMVFWIPSFSLPNVFRAAGDVIWPMGIAGFSMWVFRLGFSYLLGTLLGLGLFGIWIAMTVDWVFRGLCYVIRYRSGKWERKLLDRRE
ncbi:MAG: MATE family efflux transporter [Clostridium sp.]|jgi:putative MATE family efflux protein|nr:MATE family efflux transporter [Clostridium sp.]